jgi:hypothetical protein
LKNKGFRLLEKKGFTVRPLGVGLVTGAPQSECSAKVWADEVCCPSEEEQAMMSSNEIIHDEYERHLTPTLLRP